MYVYGYAYGRIALQLYYIVLIQFTDWNKDAEKNFTKFWPGWDDRINETNAKKEYDIHDIGIQLQLDKYAYVYIYNIVFSAKFWMETTW